MFQGSFNSQIKANHVFLSDDPIMQAIGLASFNDTSFKQIIANNLDGIIIVYPKIADYLESLNTILDLIDPTPGTYRKFNKDLNKYESVDISILEIKDLLDYHEKKSKTPSDELDSIKDDVKDNQILDIQNSLINSILLKLPKNIFGIIDEDEDNQDIRINLFFLKSTTSQSNTRIMAQRGAPMIVDVPRRPTGGRHGFRQTKNTQQSTENNIGTYENPSNDGIDDMQNVVGAPLKITYNSNTKMWESGTTQILAKLTEDVAAAQIKNVQISPTDIDSITGSDPYYSADSEYYMGGHVSTLAIPLSLENGNPNLFGPNLLKCKDGKCETVRAVNRAPRSFSAGAIVLLSNIDGEWIIQDFGANPDDLKPAAASFGEWSFTKLIADSDSYFKDVRFYDGVTIEDKNNIPNIDSLVNQSVLPKTYEYQSRLQFFYSFALTSINKEHLKNIYGDVANLSKMAALNLNLESADKITDFIRKNLFFKPSLKYFIATTFDQISKEHGGFSNKTYISKTNVSAGDLESFNGYPQATQVPLFWGPVLIDGYKKLAIDTNLNQFNQDKYFMVAFDNEPITLPTISPNNFPAELTSKIIDMISPILNWGGLGQSTITQTYIKPPFYNSQPNGINNIQFSPLYVDLAAHDDPVSRVARDPVRQYYRTVREIVGSENGQLIGDDTNLWGYMYYRNATHGPIKYTDTTGLKQALDQCGAYELNNDESLASWVNYPFLAYDCWIKNRPTNSPVGVPDEFRDNTDEFRGANLVGVIAAKQTITKPKGGKINFSCKQYFGLPQKRTVSGSAGNISILPIGGIGVVVGSNPPGLNQNAFPQWGSSINDRYDSFGTTALHIRAFDYWPEENTIYDARYYAVLHFNPGDLYSVVVSNNVGLSSEDITEKYGSQYSSNNLPPTISYVDIPRSVDQTTPTTASIDIRIPTYGVKFEKDKKPDISKDNQIILIGTAIDANSHPLRPNNEWRINPIRRGQILTEGGFKYLYHAIGLNEYKIQNKGSGFTNGEKFTLAGSKSVEIELIVNENKELENFKFISKDTNFQDENGRGMNFLPTDFTTTSLDKEESRKCFKLTIPAPQGGQAAVIEFYSGIVYLRQGWDQGPVEHVPPKLISSSSARGLGTGKGPVDATQTSDITLGENKSGKYDCFYFFHNDVTHTPMQAFTFSPGFAQHITLTIS